MKIYVFKSYAHELGAERSIRHAKTKKSMFFFWMGGGGKGGGGREGGREKQYHRKVRGGRNINRVGREREREREKLTGSYRGSQIDPRILHEKGERVIEGHDRNLRQQIVLEKVLIELEDFPIVR